MPPLAPGGSAEVKLPPQPADAPAWGGDAVDGAGGDRRGDGMGAAGPCGGLGAGARHRAGRAVAGGGRAAGRARGAALGPASFDARTGALRAVGGVAVSGLRLDVWRAPTDNDNGAPWQPDARYGLLWRELGLHRMRHRLDGVEVGDEALTVRTRVAPAAADIGLRTAYRWTSDGDRVQLTVSVTPEGDWRLSHRPPTVAVIQSKPPQVR
ncbi:hypothetical protein SGLAM104S_04721 [Streptomyces glaucescens]